MKKICRKLFIWVGFIKPRSIDFNEKIGKTKSLFRSALGSANELNQDILTANEVLVEKTKKLDAEKDFNNKLLDENGKVIKNLEELV
jgi:hypothetical protein